MKFEIAERILIDSNFLFLLRLYMIQGLNEQEAAVE